VKTHVAPAGACPFNFFTSRKWTHSQAGLAMRDHHVQILAQLTPAGSDCFEGKTSTGQDVALSRWFGWELACVAQFSRAGRLSCSGSATGEANGGAAFDGAASAGVTAGAAALRSWSR
jgi:hypothetical protein